MSLMLVAAEVADLATRIRNRITEGAAVWEVAADELPVSLSDLKGSVKAVFQSEHAVVAVLENGRTVVRQLAA